MGQNDTISIIALILNPCYLIKTMATNVEIKKGAKDNNVHIIKKFTRRVQESGIIPRMKGIRYAERTMSMYVKKVKRLKSIKNKEIREEQIKLGKISATPTRRGR